MAKTILLFDVMGTLVSEPFLTAMPQFFGMPLEQLRQEAHPTAWVDFEKDLMTEQQFCDQFFTDGRPVDRLGLRKCLFDAYEWLSGMEDLLAELHRDGFSIYALSNYPIWYEMIEEKLSLSRFLTWDFVSCRTGFRKPDPNAYLVVTQKLGVAASDCCFIDDRQENVDAAIALGMDAVLIENATTLREQFCQRGLLT